MTLGLKNVALPLRVKRLLPAYLSPIYPRLVVSSLLLPLDSPVALLQLSLLTHLLLEDVPLLPLCPSQIILLLTTLLHLRPLLLPLRVLQRALLLYLLAL